MAETESLNNGVTVMARRRCDLAIVFIKKCLIFKNFIFYINNRGFDRKK